MTRMRGVKPDLLRHEGLLDLEQETGLPVRLCFIALLMACDRSGRFQWRLRSLKAELLPLDENLDFTRVMQCLCEGDFVRHYTGPDGKPYGWVPAFTRHQNINPREQISEIPPHPDEDAFYAVSHASVTRAARVSHASEKRIDAPVKRIDAALGMEGNRKGIGREGNGPVSDCEASPPSDTEKGKAAAAIVALWPVRLSTADHYAACCAVIGAIEAGEAPDDIRAKVFAHAEAWRALSPADQRFCGNARRYFTEGRWHEDPGAHPWTVVKPGSSGDRIPTKKKSSAPPVGIESPANVGHLLRVHRERDPEFTGGWADVPGPLRRALQQEYPADGTGEVAA